MIDLGDVGRHGDGGVLAHSNFGKALEDNSLSFPAPRPLPGTTHLEVPYVIIGDVAFLLCTNMLRPYPRGNLTGVCVVFRLTWRHNSHCFIIAEEKAVFNYRLSRARRVIENSFGILAARYCTFVTLLFCDIKVIMCRPVFFLCVCVYAYQAVQETHNITA